MWSHRVWKWVVLIGSWGVASAGFATSAQEARLIANAAEGGNASAQLLLAEIYIQGTPGFERDMRRAAHWFEQAAEQGNAYAQAAVAERYERGEGVPKNLRVAADWREKAAHRGYVTAQVALGKMYLAGNGVVRSAERAEYWLNRAAIEGDTEARSQLSQLHRGPQSVGPAPADAGLARAAERGYEATTTLLRFIENAAFGIEESYYRRPPDLRPLARDGDLEAAYQLAVRYESGTYGVPRDDAQALFWFTRAAMHGSLPAIQALQRIYEKGLDGQRPDPALAQRWAGAARAAH